MTELLNLFHLKGDRNHLLTSRIKISTKPMI